MGKLEEAIKKHDLETIKELLVNDPPMIDEVDDEGRHMAFIAAATGDIAIVRYVVEYSRANMNIRDKEHRNILHYGVMSGNIEVVKYLVERVGMSPVTGDFNLVTPFDLAREFGFDHIEKYFEDVVGAKFDDLYRNPIRTGMFPDPSIVRVGEDYYMVNSSFIFFPCIPISHSKDLVHWEIIGHAITNPEWAGLDELEGGRGYWAPDISYHDGRFFITATYRLNDTGTVYRKQIVVSSDKPEGPYSKPAIIHEDGIDPSIFVDDDGRKYMLLNRGARIFELNRECTEQISEARLLYYGDNKRASEGPHLLKKDGYYYLFEAEGGTGMGHRVTVSRSKTLMGVYEPCPFNPIMRQMDEGAAIQRCGHGKPVMTQNGQWYMVYLCGRVIEGKYSILGRETALDEIIWTADGWPMVNKLQGPSTLAKRPDLPRVDYVATNSDSFGEKLGLEWMSPRPAKEGTFEISNKKLVITGDKYDLSTTDCRSVLVQRQKAFEFECETAMATTGYLNGQDAGITCYYDENTYLKYCFCMVDGKKMLKVIERIGDEEKVSLTTEIDNSVEKVYLRVTTSYLCRVFEYSTNGEEYIKIGMLDNVYYLCDEGIKRGKRFTGAMAGLYAHSGKEGCLKAEFDFFRIV